MILKKILIEDIVKHNVITNPMISLKMLKYIALFSFNPVMMDNIVNRTIK